MSWNGREPKYDIREWSPEHDKMGKVLTLSKDEQEALKGILEKHK
nr:PC4/YdbC family ssDNA-binding protein [uncultured Phascolarctobacterium sp.]